ncbi:hypothetical protein D0Y65_024808 [Glycine soja]|uniref:Uncharacterized protein n=2 Tax=Glycine subgen. Soja TaxID=1462606 RepID=K7LF50_SOYBN|nr:hypothetical protein D0Y65_024808 [Glycine soja]
METTYVASWGRLQEVFIKEKKTICRGKMCGFQIRLKRLCVYHPTIMWIKDFL